METELNPVKLTYMSFSLLDDVTMTSSFLVRTYLYYLYCDHRVCVLVICTVYDGVHAVSVLPR